MAECTIYDKLRYIAETKDLIKMAIESQDVEVLESATFRQYAEYITEIRKVSSVNGLQGDVVITLEDLGGITIDALNGYATEQWVEDKGYITGFTIPEEYVTEDDLTNYYTKEESDDKFLTEHQSLEDYYTKNDIDSKGYITAIPDEYITEDELSNELKDKVSETALNEALKGYYDKGEVDNLIENVDVTEQLQNYYTKEEIEGKKYLTEVPSEYITEEELADTLDIITELGEDIASLEENKQDKLTQGTGIKIENNVISLDYSYDLFEVVTELPTENINENKIYLVQDTDGGEENAFVEYIYVNGNWEEVGKFKTTVDLTGYATEKWVSEQGFLTEVPEEYVTDTDLGEALDGYATEQWVEDKKYLTEHQSLENYYTKAEVDEAIDNVDVTEQLQNYYTKEESDGKYLTEHQSLEDYYTKDEVDEAIKNIEVGEDVDLSDYVTKVGLPKELYDNDFPYVNTVEIVPTADTIHLMSTYVNGADTFSKNAVPDGAIHFKTINGEHILGTGNITIEGGGGGSVDLDLFEVVTELPTENINENKIYVIQPLNQIIKTIKVDGEMKPFNISDYPDLWHNEGLDTTYMQNPNLTIENLQIVDNYRTRITFSGYSDSFFVQFMIKQINIESASDQLYFGVGTLNDLTDTPPDNIEHFWSNYYGGSDWFYGENYQSFGAEFYNIEPSQTYTFDIWSNCGSANVNGLDLSSPLAVFMPTTDNVETNKYEEYIYANGAWERLGEFQPEVKFDGYTHLSVDPTGNDGKSYALFLKEDGSGDIIEVAKINGKTLLGWEAQEFSLAETKEVTQAEYDSMSKEDNVLYVITDAPEVTVPTKLSQLEQDIEIGAAYTAGDGIKIDNDTISLNTSHSTDVTNKTITLWANKSNGRTSIFQIIGSDTISIKMDNNNTNPILYVSDKVALKTDIPDVSTKQDVLVSGTNIKTINGEDILGEGNITIEGGGGNANVIELTQAEYDALTEYEEAFYLITDASSDSDMSNYYTKDEIDALIGGVENKITEINNLI